LIAAVVNGFSTRGFVTRETHALVENKSNATLSIRNLPLANNMIEKCNIAGLTPFLPIIPMGARPNRLRPLAGTSARGQH